MMKWHGSVGIWLTVALVFISLTGLTWSSFAGERFQTVLTALDARTPKLATGTLPTPPSEPGTPYVVAETSSSVPLHRDKIALDPSTGQVTEVLRFTD